MSGTAPEEIETQRPQKNFTAALSSVKSDVKDLLCAYQTVYPARDSIDVRVFTSRWRRKRQTCMGKSKNHSSTDEEDLSEELGSSKRICSAIIRLTVLATGGVEKLKLDKAARIAGTG